MRTIQPYVLQEADASTALLRLSIQWLDTVVIDLITVRFTIIYLTETNRRSLGFKFYDK